MTSNGIRTSAAIAREVEAERAGIDATLIALGDRLQPRKLAGEAWDFAAGGGGGDLVRNLNSSIRENPLPLLLVGTGLAWLMSGRSGRMPRLSHEDPPQGDRGEEIYDYPRYQGTLRRHTAASRYQSDRDDPAYSRPYTQDEAAGLSNEENADEQTLSYTVREGAARVGDRVSDAATQAGQAIDQGAAFVGARASDLRMTAHRVEEDLSRNTRRLGRQARRSFEDNPLTFALAGLAVGALFGAIVKTTKAEQELLSETSDAIKHRARDLAARGAEQAVDAVARTADAMTQEADTQRSYPVGHSRRRAGHRRTGSEGRGAGNRTN